MVNEPNQPLQDKPIAQQVNTGPTQTEEQSLLSSVSNEPVPPSGNKKKFIAIAVLLIAIVGIIGIFYLVKFQSIKENITSESQRVGKKTVVQEAPAKFAHFKYLAQPKFENAVSSSLAQSSEYKIKGVLPSASQIIKTSKLSFIPIVYAGGGTTLSVYGAARYEVTLADAKNLAQKFGINGETKREGYDPPGYYGFIWETSKEYFAVMGGSGSGGYEYFLKGGAQTGNAPSDSEATSKAIEFLNARGIAVDNSDIINVLGEITDISRRSGFRENHKQVYFRKKLNGYPIYEWEGTQTSPKTDRIEVWVGVNGRILYATNNSHWTNVDLQNKNDYVLREPNDVFEDVKNGKGKLAWMEEEGVELGGLSPVVGNFAIHGKLINVQIDGVTLAYYHERKPIEQPEFYQPMYIYTGTAILDWKSDYTPQQGEENMRGNKAKVWLLAPAVSNNSFFENPASLNNGTNKVEQPPVSVPTYYPPVQPSITPAPTTNQVTTPISTTQSIPTSKLEKQTLILKLGVVTDLEDPKRNINLSWENVPGAAKYNIYLKIAGDQNYNQAALVGTGSLSETVGVNKYIDYYFKVQACDSNQCIDSNEVFLPQEQKPTFYMKLGTVTPKDDPKEEVVLGWSEMSGTTKYNVFLRNSQTEEYGTALTGTGELSYTAVVNRQNDNYFIVQACNSETCYPSNEIFLPKQ